MTTGTVLRLERSSIHDGPGIRTVVFLKGCPLGCLWCSTPESQNQSPANEYGRSMTAEAVVAEVQKDEIFYFHSGGGVTISGGEPLAQPDFSAEILRQCRENGIHTAMETSLYAPFEAVSGVLPLTDYLFVDLKHMDPVAHRRFTGVDNRLILENLRRLAQTGFRGELVVRVPLVPGCNDDDENLRKTARMVSGLSGLTGSSDRSGLPAPSDRSGLPVLRHLELLPYHRLGLDTYRRLGIEYPLPEVAVPTREHMDERIAFTRAAAPGLPVNPKAMR